MYFDETVKEDVKPIASAGITRTLTVVLYLLPLACSQDFGCSILTRASGRASLLLKVNTEGWILHTCKGWTSILQGNNDDL